MEEHTLSKLRPMTMREELAYRRGHVLHKHLSPDLKERIRRLKPVFDEVKRTSYQKWLEGFQCDLDPESRVRQFEALASAYQTFFLNRALILPAKKEVYGLLCYATVIGEDGIAAVKMRYLTREDVNCLVRLYKAALAKGQPPFSPN